MAVDVESQLRKATADFLAVYITSMLKLAKMRMIIETTDVDPILIEQAVKAKLGDSKVIVMRSKNGLVVDNTQA